MLALTVSVAQVARAILAPTDTITVSIGSSGSKSDASSVSVRSSGSQTVTSTVSIRSSGSKTNTSTGIVDSSGNKCDTSTSSVGTGISDSKTVKILSVLDKVTSLVNG
jgi:hypothetical protein